MKKKKNWSTFTKPCRKKLFFNLRKGEESREKKTLSLTLNVFFRKRKGHFRFRLPRSSKTLQGRFAFFTFSRRFVRYGGGKGKEEIIKERPCSLCKIPQNPSPTALREKKDRLYHIHYNAGERSLLPSRKRRGREAPSGRPFLFSKKRKGRV